MHATTHRIVNEAFAEEKGDAARLAVTPIPGGAAARTARLHEGMVSVGGNLYSVPDTTRRRVLDVHVLADEVRIFEDGVLVPRHAPLEGRGERRLDPAHRKAGLPRRRAGDARSRRAAGPSPAIKRRVAPLDFYEAVGRRLAAQGEAAR